MLRTLHAHGDMWRKGIQPSRAAQADRCASQEEQKMHLGVCLAPSFWLPLCVRYWSWRTQTPVPKSILNNAKKDLRRHHPLKWPRTWMHTRSKATHQSTPLVQLQTPIWSRRIRCWLRRHQRTRIGRLRSAFPKTCAQRTQQLHAYRVSCKAIAAPIATLGRNPYARTRHSTVRSAP